MGITMADVKENLHTLVAEFVGTAVLLLTFQIAFGAKEAQAALCVGLILAALVYAIGPVSGAHFNPALSLANYLRDTLSFPELLLYWVAQIAGGFSGALLGRLISGVAVVPVMGTTHHFMQAFLAELTFSGVFVFVALSVVPKTARPQPFYGAAIGVVYFAGLICTRSISGGALNPTVALSLVLVKKVNELHYALWIMLANTIGAIIATIFFYLADTDEERVHTDSILKEIRARILHPKMNTATTGETEALLSA